MLSDVPFDSRALCLATLEPKSDAMNKGIRFADEFKRGAVAQVVERGYAVSEMTKRMGARTKSIYT